MLTSPWVGAAARPRKPAHVRNSGGPHAPTAMTPKLSHRPGRLRLGALAWPLALGLAALGAAPAARAADPGTLEGAACVVPGHWQVPGGTVLPRGQAIARATEARVVLLGENHDDAAHHHWQLDTLAALYRLRPDLALGVEMFPRRLQPVLDAWSRGELDDAAFLQRTEWQKTWGYEPELYMPIFRFVRDHRIPLRALNVDRSEVRKVSGGGWQALDADLRTELGTPAAPLPDYLESLRETFDAHAAHMPETHRPKDGDFERFVEAQLLWDRAMAAGIASQTGARPMVAIMGSGHIRFGHGVPHQLRDLAVSSIYSLVPLSPDEDCSEVREGLADVVVAPANGPVPHNPHRSPDGGPPGNSPPENASPDAQLRAGL
ncbi:MAG: hypothetical protein FGM40_04480 [Rhodocyclaceae bacterium]|nr:hypothetical protein [Rhodocyclaceae bacterium]